MKSNTAKKAVKPGTKATVGTDRHPNRVAKGKGGAKAKARAEETEDQDSIFDDMVKLARTESGMGAITGRARKPAKAETVAITKAEPATKRLKAKPTSSTRKSPKPKQVIPTLRSQPGHTSASESDGASAPTPLEPKRGRDLHDKGTGVTQELPAAGAGHEVDFSIMTPPGEPPGGAMNGEADDQANGQGSCASPTSLSLADPASNLDGRGIGPLVTDPKRTIQEPEIITLNNASSNNRIAPHLVVQTPPSDSKTNQGEIGDAKPVLPTIENVSPPETQFGACVDKSASSNTPTTIGDSNEPPLDPFDPARLRMSQDFAGSTGVKKLIVTIPVDKPSKEPFVRTHPDPAYRLMTCVIDLKLDKETYLVDPSLWVALAGEPTFVAKLLVTTITRQGVLSLWPIRLPGPDGKIDEWNRSAMEAADAARNQWVRVTANMNLGANEIQVATGIAIEPEFPAIPMKEILRIAFKGRYIDSIDHPVLRKLRGEI